MKAHKIMVVGLDGATYDLIKPWVSQGKLPTFQKLLLQGSAGPLRTTIPPMTGPAWTSFMTGKNPGKHGIYDWIYRHPDSYQVSPLTAQHCQEPAVWDILSAAGKRVCLFNIPMTFPPKPVNGLMISGLPAPSTQVTVTYPKELLSEVEAQFGPYQLYPDPGQGYSDSGIDAFIENLYQTTRARLKIFEYLRAREDWDFFMLVFNGTDTVQHVMWKYMDPKHPLYDPEKAQKYGNAILDFYIFIDQALSYLINSLDDDTVLMLMSDHGFGPFHRFIHVNNWLRQEGYLKIHRTLRARVKSYLFDLGFSPMAVYDRLMQFGFGKLKREVVRGHGQGLLKNLFLSFDEVDWSSTQAYSLGNVGQIFINLKGREPQGIVEPGEEYETLRRQIVERLNQLHDPDTGEKVVQEIYRREEVYAGSSFERAADILFIPTRMEYFGFGEYEFGSHRIIEPMKRGISGTHRMDGIFLLWGDPVQSNRWITSAKITDLAPTILHLMGLPVPADMDGAVLTETLMPEYYPAAEPSSPALKEGTELQSPMVPVTGKKVLTPEEEKILIQRLRDLGYVS